MDASELLGEVVSWAAGEVAVFGVALVGSHARGEAGPDSDVDVMILAETLQPYLEDAGWAARFGKVVSQVTEDWGRVTSLRVVYTGGLEVEFGFTTPDWADVPVDAGTRRVVSDGMLVLYDPEGGLEALQRAVTGSA